MKTEHSIYYTDARQLAGLRDESVDLVVTSPPYPMIEMWDELFFALNPLIRESLEAGDPQFACQLMHAELEKVWAELFRVLKPGAFACINIGDATRTVNGRFRLYANHSRVLHQFVELGFDVLPLVLWRKQTNAPNKFMGSGMLPAGAYVTLEHEYILIFRKGGKRAFNTRPEKDNRLQSAIFWEERNSWFSDLWDFKGTRQNTNDPDQKLRERSAAFPFQLPFRLINMYSVLGDTVLDPFLGTGTTSFAAMAAGRNSIGCEIEPLFADCVNRTAREGLLVLNRFNEGRLSSHLQFVEKCLKEGKSLRHESEFYGFPVMTAQEKKLQLPFIKQVDAGGENFYRVEHCFPREMKEIRKISTPASEQLTLF